MAYASIDAETVATILTNAGTNAKQQLWSMEVSMGSLGLTQFANLLNGGGPGGSSPIRKIVDFQKLHGTKVNFRSEAPLGGTGRQGSAEERIGRGEDIKFQMYDWDIGVQWHGVKGNKISLAQTMLGVGSFDAKAKMKLKEWFAHLQSRAIEAELRRSATARNTYYVNNRGSINALTSTDTFMPTDAKRVSDLMAGNMATQMQIGKRKNGDQPIYSYYIMGNNRLYDDMHQSSDWQTLLSNAAVRGDDNYLFYGGLPRYGGTIMDEFTVQSNTAYGPQGCYAAPIAYLGEAIVANPVTGTVLKGGGDATGAAKTDRMYFQMFPAAAGTFFEQTKIAATTGTEHYCLIRNLTASAATGDAGKFGMYAYQVNNGNQITLTKALRSVEDTSGNISYTTVGAVTWNSGVWTTDFLTDQHPIGSEIIPCNSKGQPYVSGYAFGDEGLYCAYGSINGEVAMAQRTFEDRDHGREFEIGCQMAWGVNTVEDANGLASGVALIYGAWNPVGLPTIV